MAISGSLQLSLEFGIRSNHCSSKRLRNSKTRGHLYLLGADLSSISLYSWGTNLSKKRRMRVCTLPSRIHRFECRCFLNPGPSSDATWVKNVVLTLARSFNRLQGSPLVIKFASAVGIVVFAIWGLGPLVKQSRNLFLRTSDSSWKRSSLYHVTTSYVRPLLLWTGAIFICRALDPIILPSNSAEIVKQRLLNFVRALSTVLAFAQCLSSVIQHAQKYFMETNDPDDSRNMGFQFAGRSLYTAVWVAAVSLFMELLGFSTQRWLTAGGLGTVLLTLAGREILTNFLSSIMIHATRPFVVNDWIQTKIQGYDVSGTVEHVGWWSPTIIRGDDREAIHIPNHKFTVNIVRNLSQKTHWRIKTHLAISHLDVGKINNIVADMRKVLAKNPQIEQQKLHRRVFLDYVNPENQALAIMISCFVKTSRFEEYLCVKEAIILDLIRVITHHRARLATPIRTVQKIFTDSTDLGNVPVQDSVYDQRAALNRLLLIEPSYKITEEDSKPKTQARSPRVDEDEDSNKATTPRSTQSTPDNKTDAKEQDAKQPPSATKPSLEDNIVLGVALDGSKRTLPIEEEDMSPTPASNPEDAKEMATLRSSSNPATAEKEKNDTKRSNASGSTGGDQSEQKDL